MSTSMPVLLLYCCWTALCSFSLHGGLGTGFAADVSARPPFLPRTRSAVVTMHGGQHHHRVSVSLVVVVAGLKFRENQKYVSYCLVVLLHAGTNACGA